MRRYTIPSSCVLIAMLVCAACLLSCAREERAPRPVAEFKDDPEAHALYDRMLRTIRSAPSLYYESAYRWEYEGFKFGVDYRIWMKKPNYTRIESRSIGGDREGVLVGDGDYFWIYWPTGRPAFPGTDSPEYERTRLTSYMKKYAPEGGHSIAHDIALLDGDIHLTILEPSIFHGYDDPMQPFLVAVRSLGREKVGEEECSVVEAIFMDGQRLKQFWISERDNLPRRMKQVVAGENAVVTEESLSVIAVGTDMPPDLFAWQPPEGWVEFRRLQLEDGLLKAGTQAPEFDLELADGGRFRLSDHRGSLVWLVFWKSGCQPCRWEFPLLEEIHKAYRDSGLVIVGVNVYDDKEIARNFLAKTSVTFPCIADKSGRADEVLHNEYQTIPGMSGVPLNYIVGRDGNVLEAWYGCEERAELQKRIGKYFEISPQ
jgi:peroxiredoxin/outer membrane lipoprotein-sorting protein